MARQLFHAVRKVSALFGSSYRSATSRMRVPRALDVVSVKSEKKESMRTGAVILLFLKEDIELRNWVIFMESFCSSKLARSITSLCRSCRTCSCGVRSVCDKSRLLTACVAASTLAEGRGTVMLAGSRAGGRAAAGVGAGVNWPPKVRVNTDCAL